MSRGWDRALTAPAGRRRGMLAALAKLLVEPVEAATPLDAEAADGWTGTARPVVAVAGFAPRCGTTTVARALAVELAQRDGEGAAVVSTDAIAGGGVPLGTAAAGRLGRAVERALPARTRAVGRLCLTAVAGSDHAALVDAARDLAPVVLDVEDPAGIAVAASLVDSLVLVAAPAVEPALAPVLSRSVARVGPEPVVVLNRDRDGSEGWEGRCAVRLPQSRLAAQLALAGRDAHGELGRAIARLADVVAEGRES